MEKLLRGKVVGGKMLEGYNSFMYKDSNKRNERILAKRTTIQNEMERQQQQKAAEKAARKAEKQAQKEQAKAEKEQRRLERQQAFEENTEEDENRRVFFGKEDEEEVFEATVIEINQLVDEKFTKFEKTLKGMDLLKRNLNASKMYICDDDDFMRVQSIKEVEPEIQDLSKVFLLLDTNREYYVIGFDCIRTF